jgi:hypothetical protein
VSNRLLKTAAFDRVEKTNMLIYQGIAPEQRNRTEGFLETLFICFY